MTRCSLVALLFLVTSLSWGALGEADEFSKLRSSIRHRLTQEQVPSLAVAVAREGKIIWEEGFGWADRENRRRATPHTPYSLASISKPITATGLMVLRDRKQLALDDPVNKHLGESKLRAMVGDVEKATLRLVANHTSGLPLHYQFFYEDEPYRRPSMDESIRRYGRLTNKPGETYQYANFGYGVLDHIIHLKSGKTFADFMKSEVFLPLGMLRTSVGIDPALAKHQAVRYGADQKPIAFYEFDHPGASAVYSSAHDLAMFGMYHLGELKSPHKSILKNSSRLEMQKPTSDLGQGVGYGVGWRIDKENGYRTISHTGSMPGVRTKLILVPEAHLVIATLANGRSSLPHRVSNEIIEALLPKFGENRRKASRSRVAKRRTSPFQPTKKLIGFWEGEMLTYAGRSKIKMWIRKDGEIHLQHQGQLKMLVNNPSFDGNFLRGVYQSDIKTGDANRRPYHLHLKLKLRGSQLGGSVSAVSLNAGRRGGNAQSHWLSVTKKSALAQPTSLFDGKSLGNWEVVTKNDFAKHGKIAVADKQIVIGKGQPASGIRWKGSLPRNNYQIELEARRIEGDDFFCGLTFPVGKSYCTLICGGWGGGTTGLSSIDNASADENDTTGYTEFKRNQWYHIRVRVTDNRVQAWIDGQSILSTERKGHKFSIWWEQEPVRPLGVASWYTKAALRNIKILPP